MDKPVVVYWQRVMQTNYAPSTRYLRVPTSSPTSAIS
jgi:hypothetical protein